MNLLEHATGLTDGYSPQFIAPYRHFADTFRNLVFGEKQYIALIGPARSGKSTSIVYPLIALYMAAHPKSTVLYATFSPKLSEMNVSHKLIHMAQKCHMSIRQEGRVFRTSNGGMLFPADVGSALAGVCFDLMVVDSPYRGFEEYKRDNIRNAFDMWCTNATFCRTKPNGNILVCSDSLTPTIPPGKWDVFRA